MIRRSVGFWRHKGGENVSCSLLRMSSLRGSFMGTAILTILEGRGEGGARGCCRLHAAQKPAVCLLEEGWELLAGARECRGKLSVHNTEVSLVSVIRGLQHSPLLLVTLEANLGLFIGLNGLC